MPWRTDTYPTYRLSQASLHAALVALFPQETDFQITVSAAQNLVRLILSPESLRRMITFVSAFLKQRN